MKSTLYIAICIDTEGPLYEDEEILLSRIESTFNVQLERKAHIITELQQGLHIPEKHKQGLQIMLSSHLTATHKTWEDLDGMLDVIGRAEFRGSLADAEGEGMAYTWFCLDHMGYTYNPRRRDIKNHAVFDHYKAYSSMENNARDRVQLHYHPLPYNKYAHSCATYYFNNNHLMEILGRKIVERQWFPNVFRPGFHTIRPDSHWFLEQWIPFDYSNQSMDWVSDQPDIPDGRYGDWRNAPQSWRPYHPSHDDYQRSGHCNRWTFRCLNIMSRVRQIRQQDVRAAFQEALEHGSAVLAITDHDFRRLDISLQNFVNMIRMEAQAFPDVAFKYTDALTAARLCTACDVSEPLLEVHLTPQNDNEAVLHITSDTPLFGPQPFLIIVTKEGEYRYDNLDRGENNLQWFYIFDWQTTSPSELKYVGLAATYASGKVKIALFDAAMSQWEMTTLD